MNIAPLILAILALPSAARGDGPVILDFTATWCQPCQQMKPAVAQLVKAGYPVQAVDYDHSPLREKYKVTAIPTFVVIDEDGRELARTQGFQPARNIATLFNQAQEVSPQADAQPEVADEEAEIPARKIPDPWKTVVRIKIENNLSRPGSIEFGSGTIIHSTPEETIILTCAHIFKISGLRQQYPPKKFPLKIEVHLSDGIIKAKSAPDANGGVQAGVHMVEKHEGEAIDYDFGGDVGLIRIRPGKRLPATPVVSKDWTPKTGLKMTAVGCSEGHDASAWSTQITNPTLRGVDGFPNYEAIECIFAPKQGRSGGGLYTLDGRLAGVCDFAEPQQNRGLYATPRTIHKFLDRNDLTICYAPDAGRSRGQSGALVAQERPAPRTPRNNVADRLLLQGADDPPRKKLTMPPPGDLGVAEVASDDGAASGNRRRPMWDGRDASAQVRAASGASNRRLDDLEDEPREATPVDASMDSRIDRDPFANFGSGEKEAARPLPPKSAADKSASSKIWKPKKTPKPPGLND